MRGGILYFRVVAFRMFHAGSTRHGSFRSEHGGVRDGVGKEEEERVSGFVDEPFGAQGVEFGVIVFAGVEIVSLQLDLFFPDRKRRAGSGNGRPCGWWCRRRHRSLC